MIILHAFPCYFTINFIGAEFDTQFANSVTAVPMGYNRLKLLGMHRSGRIPDMPDQGAGYPAGYPAGFYLSTSTENAMKEVIQTVTQSSLIYQIG